MTRGGGIVSFVLRGGLDQGRRFLDTLGMCSLTANLGDARTIATHPASTTHASLTDEERAAVGIEPGLVRISVGLEHPDDVIADVAQALERSASWEYHVRTGLHKRVLLSAQPVLRLAP